MKFIMKLLKPLLIPIAAAILLLILYVGGYVVLPEGIGDGASGTSKGWSAAATGIGASDSGDVRIDLAIRNETGAWSAMQAVAGKAAPVEGLIQKPDVEITALNDVVLTLTHITRTDKGLRFEWRTVNPGEYPTYVHIGDPPVIGENGILYGFYQSQDIASAPITPAGKSAEWTTEVAVPKDVKGLYILLSVETGKQRLFKNYCLDITDK
jgi:hypothetical protein